MNWNVSVRTRNNKISQEKTMTFFMPSSFYLYPIQKNLQKELLPLQQLNIYYMEQLQVIQSKIYEIRGQKVMLDRDLAELYQVTTSNLNKAVKRNIKRFPPDFMFQLTNEEFAVLRNNLIFQNGTSNWGGTRKLPYAFTEQGLAMLSGLLNSDIAIQVNINIMRAFVAVRQMISFPTRMTSMKKRLCN